MNKKIIGIIALLLLVCGVGFLFYMYMPNSLKLKRDERKLYKQGMAKDDFMDFDKLMAENPHVRFWVKGEGVNTPIMESGGEDVDMYSNVDMHGNLTDTPPAYLPYHIEEDAANIIAFGKVNDDNKGALSSMLTQPSKKLIVYERDKLYNCELVGMGKFYPDYQAEFLQSYDLNSEGYSKFLDDVNNQFKTKLVPSERVFMFVPNYSLDNESGVLLYRVVDSKIAQDQK